MPVFSEVRREQPNRIAGLEMDVNWINECFMLPKMKASKNNPIDQGGYSWMYYSTADTKFVNTSLGGNFSINQPAAYTIFADPPVGLLTDNIKKGNIDDGITGGMGQYYSEAIDDNAHRIFLRFGHPQYKGLITFFTSFYNSKAAMLGNQGRTWADAFYFAGKVIGTIFALPLWVFRVLSWGVNMVLGRPTTSYYSLSPSMPLYWARVDQIANRLAAYMHLIPEPEVQSGNSKDGYKDVMSNPPNSGGDAKVPIQDDWQAPESLKKKAYSANFNEFNKFMPGLFNETGGIDIWRIVNKTNRMLAATADARQKAMTGATSPEQLAKQIVEHAKAFKADGARTNDSIKKYLKDYHETPLGAVVLIGKDGKEYEVYRRDAITDRIEEGKSLDPTAMEAAQNQSAAPPATTDGTQGADAAATTPAVSDSGDSASADAAPSTASSFVGSTNLFSNSLTATTGGGGTTPTTTPDSKKTEQQKKDDKNKNTRSSNGGLLGIGGSIPDAKNEAVKNGTIPASEINGDGNIGAEQTAETPLSTDNSQLAQAPTGDEAKAMLKDYAQQDSLIYSILETEEGRENEEEEGTLTRVLGWLSPATNVATSAVEYFANAYRRGSDFIGFKVDAVPTVSESWSNSSTEGEIAGAINGLSNSARAARYSLSDFKTGFGVVDAALTAVRSTVAGAMDGFHVSGILALAGSGMVDIPKRFAESSTQMTTSSYTIELRSPYGDPMSVFLNIYLPFCCLLAGALPISHGNQAFGSPFFCELYDRGRNTIRIGMIESLSVTRGAGTTAWSQDGLPLGIDVSFSIANMTTVMHAPIDTGLSSLFPWNHMFATDTGWQDYASTLANLSIEEQINPYKQISLQWAAYRISFDSYFNVARASTFFADWGINRFASNVLNAVSPDFKTSNFM